MQLIKENENETRIVLANAFVVEQGLQGEKIVHLEKEERVAVVAGEGGARSVATRPASVTPVVKTISWSVEPALSPQKPISFKTGTCHNMSEPASPLLCTQKRKDEPRVNTDVQLSCMEQEELSEGGLKGPHEENIHLDKIPPYEFDQVELDELRHAERDFALGADFFPSQYDCNPPNSGFQERLREYRQWEEKFNLDFETWYSHRNWIPMSMGKSNRNFAKTLFLNEDARRFVEGMSPEQGEQIFSKIRTNYTGLHLQRLLTTVKSSSLTDFSLAWLSYIKADPDNHYRRICKSIPVSIDGDAALQFWTISPYILGGLKENGWADQDAFEAVLDWSNARTPSGEKEEEDAVYPGIGDQLRRQTAGGWALTGEPNDITHQLAKRVGKNIAENIIKIYKKA